METNTEIKTKPIEVNPSNIHIFEDDNRYFLLVVPTSHFFEVDKMTYDFLELLQQDGYTYEKVQNELIKHYKKEELKEVASELKETLIAPDMPKKKLPTDYPIRTVMFNVTQHCNLRCIYCYGGDGGYGNPKHMSKEVAKQSVDFFTSRMKEGDKCNFSFFGGEPLVNFDLIKYVVRYSKKIAEEKKIKFTYGMTTNGTLLTDEVIDYLDKNKISAMISMDGGKEIQDRNRPLTNNKSSFDMMYSGMKKLMKIKKSQKVRATFIHGSNIKEIIIQLTKIGFSSIHIVPVTTDKEKSYALTKKDYYKVQKELEEISKDKKENGKDSKYSNFSNFSKKVELTKRTIINKRPCGAGRGLVGLDVDGNIYLCHRFVGNQDYIVGNIFDGLNERRTEFLQDIVDNRENCKKCWARYFCGGGCYHDNFVTTSNEKIATSSYCEFFKQEAIRSLKQLTHYMKFNGISLTNL